MADSLGARIALARASAQMSRAGLARALGVDVKTVYRWEHDLAPPISTSLGMAVEVLGCDAGWLLTGIGDPPAQGPIESAGTGG